jgi:hypothetical protein
MAPCGSLWQRIISPYPKLLERLGPHKAGKGCLYVKRLDDVDRDTLRELVERRLRVHRGADRSTAGAGGSGAT